MCPMLAEKPYAASYEGITRSVGTNYASAKAQTGPTKKTGSLGRVFTATLAQVLP